MRGEDKRLILYCVVFVLLVIIFYRLANPKVIPAVDDFSNVLEQYYTGKKDAIYKNMLIENVKANELGSLDQEMYVFLVDISGETEYDEAEVVFTEKNEFTKEELSKHNLYRKYDNRRYRKLGADIRFRKATEGQHVKFDVKCMKNGRMFLYYGSLDLLLVDGEWKLDQETFQYSE